MKKKCEHKWSTWTDFGLEVFCVKCGFKRNIPEYDWRHTYYKDKDEQTGIL